jgi:hypothetical protein
VAVTLKGIVPADRDRGTWWREERERKKRERRGEERRHRLGLPDSLVEYDVTNWLVQTE